MRIRGIALSAAGATVVAALAAQAVSADTRPGSTGIYSVSLTGSQRSVVTRTGTETDDVGCTVRHDDRDRQTIVFASRRRAALTFSSRLPLLRFDLSARVTGSFHRKTSSTGAGEDCVSAPKTTNKSCGPARLPARLALRPRKGRVVRFDGGFVRARDRKRCATTLAAPDAFIVPTERRLEKSVEGAVRVFFRGHLVQRTTVRGNVRKTTTVDWKLVLTRVG